MPVLRSFVNGRGALDAEVTKQDGLVVATYDVLITVAKEW